MTSSVCLSVCPCFFHVVLVVHVVFRSVILQRNQYLPLSKACLYKI